jgi:hypothetical protein
MNDDSNIPAQGIFVQREIISTSRKGLNMVYLVLPKEAKSDDEAHYQG